MIIFDPTRLLALSIELQSCQSDWSPPGTASCIVNSVYTLEINWVKPETDIIIKYINY